MQFARMQQNGFKWFNNSHKQGAPKREAKKKSLTSASYSDYCVQHHKQSECSWDWPTRLWLWLPLRSSRTRANECAARHFVGPGLKIYLRGKRSKYIKICHIEQYKWPIPTLSKVNWAKLWTAFLPSPSERQRPWHTSKSHLRSKVVAFAVALTLASLTHSAPSFDNGLLIFYETKNRERKVHLHHMRWWLHCRCTGLASIKSRSSSVLGS